MCYKWAKSFWAKSFDNGENSTKANKKKKTIKTREMIETKIYF